MGAGIYVIKDNGQLVEMAERQYDSEDLLQGLLAEHPNLLAGDQMDSAVPRRWLLISREMPLPDEPGGAGRWSVDHLFLDQDGIPTLIEVKRSTDTRIRREVVGQMLDYAANCVKYWPVETIRATLEAHCKDQGHDADQAVSDFLNGGDPQAFWQTVKTNLLAGKLRMVFVADLIPTELERVVEFLNEQMDPAEVLAVEIKQFTGEKLRTLVPRLIGRTAKAEQKKETGTRQQRRWDEASFFHELDASKGAEVANTARQILQWASTRQLPIWCGKGRIQDSFYPTVKRNGVAH